MQSNGNEGFDIRYEERDGYLYAFVSGKEDSLEISQAFWRCLIDECRKRFQQRLLVEEAFPNQLTASEIYELVVTVKKDLTFPLKVAFVDRNVAQYEVNLFAETLAVNRGLYGKLFSDVKEAEAWLLA